MFEIKELGYEADGIVRMQFSFSDTGIGMRPEFLEHIFDTFTREQDSRVDKTVGSGLGMAITKKIVNILGGELDVTSQPGVGTTFVVTLPFQTAALDLSLDQAERDGLNLLLVDEDASARECAAQIVQDIGLKGTCVSNESTMVEKVLQAHAIGEDYNVVILDWETQGRDSRESVQRLREELRELAPTFIAAAYDWDDVEKEVQALGISGFLTKPLFRSTLCEGLKKIIFNKESFRNGIKKESPFNFKGKRFLLAEDNELNREIAIELLSATGAWIDYATDGLQCVQMFNSSPVNYYDLILMDIQMPVMNGYTAAKSIRDLDREDAKTIQIWAMTADAFVEDVEKAKSVGMNGHFAKPLDIHSVNSELSRFLL